MKSFKRLPTNILLVALLTLGIGIGLVAFQQYSDVSVEGFLDKEQKIAYAGGILPESNRSFHTTIRWHGNYPEQSDVEHYVQSNRMLGETLLADGVKDFYVGVTLRDYLSFPEFAELASSTGFTVRDMAVRGTLPELSPKERITFWGIPPSGRLDDLETTDLLKDRLSQRAKEVRSEKLAKTKSNDPSADPFEVLEDEEIKSIQVDEGDYVLNGVYAFAAVTDEVGYKKLLEDPRVLNVDVTATFVYQQIRGKGVNWEEFSSQVQLMGYETFSVMEYIGLYKFKDR